MGHRASNVHTLDPLARVRATGDAGSAAVARTRMSPQNHSSLTHWNAAEDEGVSLWELWETAWADKWWIVAFALVAAALGATWSWMQPDVYRARVVLLPVDSLQAQPTVSTAGESASATSARGLFASPQVPLLTLRSERFAEQFIEQHELLPLLFAEFWDKSAKRWIVDGRVEAPDMRDAVSYFTSDVLAVESDPRTGLTSLSVSWSDPALAREWADALIQDLNDTLRAQALADAERNVEHLKAQMKQTGAATVQQALARLLEVELQREMFARVQPAVAFAVIDPARTPKDPVGPQRIKFTLIAFGGGALLGAMVVFLRRSAAQRREQLEAAAAAQREYDEEHGEPHEEVQPLPALRPASRSGISSVL